MSLITSPYSNVPNELVAEFGQFLDLADAMKHTRVDKRNNQHSLIGQAEIRVSGDLVGEAFSHMQPSRFPNVETFVIAEAGWANPYPHEVAELKIKGQVTNYTFEYARDMPSDFPNQVFASVDSVKRVMIQYSAKEDPSATGVLSPESKAHIQGLVELNFHGSLAPYPALADMLDGLRTLTSVDLCHQSVNEQIFHELTQNLALTHLNLGSSRYNSANGMDGYAILSGCKSLQSFTAGAEMTEDSLIAILTENPDLRDLDLSHCDDNIVTDRVLATLANHNEKLNKLVLPHMLHSPITDEGFLSFTSAAKFLRSVSLNNLDGISSSALAKGLKNLENLTELKFSRELDDEVMGAIATKIKLEALSIAHCSTSEAGLLALRSLVNLEQLNVNGNFYINDQTACGFIDHLPKLRTLLMDRWKSDLSAATLQHIRNKMDNGTSKLEVLSVGLSSYFTFDDLHSTLGKSAQNPLGLQSLFETDWS